MECNVCGRPFDVRRKPNCTSCAQAILYTPRIQQVSALLDREKQHNHTEAIVRPGNDGVLAALPEDADWDVITTGIKKNSVERSKAEQEVIEARINDIMQSATKLRQQIESYKDYATKQKDAHARRRKDLATERKQLENRRARLNEPVLSLIKKSGQKLEKTHMRTIDARAVLCKEVSALSGLQRIRGRDDKSEFRLGGLPIPDLRDLNGKVKYDNGDTAAEPHETISASLDNVCRLVGSCCHYLSIRLPAEIILPPNGSPYAMILPEKASYKFKDTTYPGVARNQSSSPSASKLLDGNALPRPRSLRIDRPLSQLVREDSKAFHLFVEGVVYLAWDIAWLCRSQGMGNINSFDEVCAIGKNLYRLLVAQESCAPPKQTPTRHCTPDKGELSTSATRIPTAQLGDYSHGGAFRSLSSADGQDLIRGWRLGSPARLVDRLKSFLLTEISGAEWDFVEDDVWDEDREDERAVLVGGARHSVDSNRGPGESLMTIAEHERAIDSPYEKPKGSNGWMKVRGRTITDT